MIKRELQQSMMNFFPRNNYSDFERQTISIDRFQFLLTRANIPHKYKPIFINLYIQSEKKEEELIFIDGGAHAGVFCDVALACGGICYAYEPNIFLYTFLKNLYKNNNNIILSNKALSHEAGKMKFYNINNDLIGTGNSLIKTNFYHQEDSGYEVETINFCSHLKELILKHGHIALVKLDIEGAEFEILNKLIEEKLYKNIDYIMVETHERFFENPQEKLKPLQQAILDNNINNIFLDWI